MRAAVLVAVALLAAGCGARDYTKEGASEEQFVKDEGLCRSQVRRMTASQRHIDDSQRDVHRADQARTGQTALPEMMANQGDAARGGRLMEQCMSARGWTPKSQWWQRLGS